MSANRKIIGATENVTDGVEFKSKLEARVYKELLRLGYKPDYEPLTSTLLGSFTPSHPWLLDGNPQTTRKGIPNKVKRWEYTPDFIVTEGCQNLIIECKGFSNDLHPYKRKMFLKNIDSMPNWHYCEVKTLRGLRKTMEWFNKLTKQFDEKSLRDKLEG